jgi:NAD(P)-dependent dehydrogenase (short-subunit alcohol dehydrogenase family)
VALVTGASSGIGRAIAVGLAEAGAAVGCLDRGDVGDTVDEITSGEGRARALSADVTDAAALDAAVETLQAELGPLRLAVNAAGIANAAPAEAMDAAQGQTVIDVNLGGVFKSCQAEARALLDNGGGAIVNIASMSGTIVNRGLLQAHYNASKAGVIHLSKSLAMEWADRGIRVNVISPGYTATEHASRGRRAGQAVRGRHPDGPHGDACGDGRSRPLPAQRGVELLYRHRSDRRRRFRLLVTTVAPTIVRRGREARPGWRPAATTRRRASAGPLGIAVTASSAGARAGTPPA